MNNIQNIIIVALVAVVLFLAMCNGGGKVQDEIDIQYFSDTTFVSDTIITIDSIIHYKDVHHYHVNVDTFFISPVDSGLNAYVFNEIDSLLNATITIHSKYLPIVDFEYRMKQIEIHTETTIENNTTIKDSTVVTIKQKKHSIGIGISLLGGKNNLGFAPQIGYINKKGFEIEGGYDVINNQVILGFKKYFSFKGF